MLSTEIDLEREPKSKKKISFMFRKKTNVNLKSQIFKITLTGLLLGLAVAASMLEIPLPLFAGVKIPFRIFDALIIAFAIPIVGLYYSLGLAIIEPWLHLWVDSDHPPIQMVFDNVANICFVLSFYLIYYFMFRFRHENKNGIKKDIVKKIGAGSILIPLNALIATLAFILTLVVLNFNPSLKGGAGDEYDQNIINFFKNIAPVFFILFAFEMLRFTFIFLLFSILERKIGHIRSRYN